MSIIPLCSFTASAASNNSGWKEVETYYIDYTNNKVTLYKQETKTFLGYYSRIKLEATKTTFNDKWPYTIEQRTTYSYISSNHYSLTPLTVKQICALDSKLRTSGIYTMLENIFICEWVGTSSGQVLVNQGYKSWNKMVSQLKTDAAYDSLAKALGTGAQWQDAACLVMDIYDACNSRGNLNKIANGWISLTALCGLDYQRRAIIQDNELALFSKIEDISNAYSYTTTRKLIK